MQRIDVYNVLKGKNPRLARRIPRPVINYLRRIVHEDELNEAFAKYADMEGIDFIRAALRDMDISYHSAGLERLDPGGRYVFASNHPFGGLDGLMLADEVFSRFGGVKVIVNDLLMNVEPIKGLFVPINKHGRQSGGGAGALNDAFASDTPIITFPAGLCSRRNKGIVCDLEWKSNFVRKAVRYGRDVVPVYFDGRLSNRFYRLANIRKALGMKANIEMLYLVDEMFRQRGSRFEIRFGDPIPCGVLAELSPADATRLVREKSYALAPRR